MIIATANAKGGVGKSTIAVHLALWLYDKGESVTLVDADHQNSSSLWAREAEPSLSVLSLHSPDDLIKQVKNLARSTSYVIVDGPAGLDEITRALLLVADLALIPCGPSLLDVRAASLAVTLLESAQLVRDGKPAALFVCNKLQSQTRLSRDLLEAAHAVGIPVAHTPLHFRQVYADAVSQSSAVTRMGYRGREASAELTQLFQEVLYGETPINDGGPNVCPNILSPQQ